MTASASKRRSPGDEFARSRRAAQLILAKTKLRPCVAIILGSGLGSLADDLAATISIPFKKIPGFPIATAEGHAGTLVIGKWGNTPLAVMKGRPHLYEGNSAREAAFPIRVLRQMGVRAVILTNASGAINTSCTQGTLVAIRDHINLQGDNPLTGPNDPRLGPRFPDMSEAYCKKYRAIAGEEAQRLKIPLPEGTYAALPGPNYETPAEIRFLKTLGADLVGMSTVPEVIAARHMEMRVLALSYVANMAAGILEGEKIDHSGVLETGNRVRNRLALLLRAVVPRIVADVA